VSCCRGLEMAVSCTTVKFKSFRLRCIKPSKFCLLWDNRTGIAFCHVVLAKAQHPTSLSSSLTCDSHHYELVLATNHQQLHQHHQHKQWQSSLCSHYYFRIAPSHHSWLLCQRCNPCQAASTRAVLLPNVPTTRDGVSKRVCLRAPDIEGIEYELVRWLALVWLSHIICACTYSTMQHQNDSPNTQLHSRGSNQLQLTTKHAAITSAADVMAAMRGVQAMLRSQVHQEHRHNQLQLRGEDDDDNDELFHNLLACGVPAEDVLETMRLRLLRAHDPDAEVVPARQSLLSEAIAQELIVAALQHILTARALQLADLGNSSTISSSSSNEITNESKARRARVRDSLESARGQVDALKVRDSMDAWIHPPYSEYIATCSNCLHVRVLLVPCIGCCGLAFCVRGGQTVLPVSKHTISVGGRTNQPSMNLSIESTINQ
jgi:hypothetical protein